MKKIAPLPHRGVLEIQGEDKASFLQGLISNDINTVSPGKAIYATLLTPQGRFLFDFFICENEDSYLLDAEADRLPDLLKKLTAYKLRSKVLLTLRPDVQVYALWGEDLPSTLALPPERGAAHEALFIDPRLLELGARLIGGTAQAGFAFATPEDYDLHRLELGVPEGGRELIPEKSILLEAGLDELNAISWTKGCYMGQELTARTKYRGLVRKRLFPVKIEGTPPEEGAEIFLKDKPIGKLLSHRGGLGLALLRLEALDSLADKDALECGGAVLKFYTPFWMRVEPPASSTATNSENAPGSNFSIV